MVNQSRLPGRAHRLKGITTTIVAAGILSACASHETTSAGGSGHSPTSNVATGTLAGFPTKIGIFSSISCPTTTYCVAVGKAKGSGASPQSGVAAYTNDGGISWSISSGLNGIYGDALVAVSCATSSDCVAAGPNGAIYSVNGGKSWAQSGGNETGGQTAVSCAKLTYCVVVGTPSGTNVVSGYSTNGGATFSPGVAPADEVVLNAVSCPTKANCVAVGNDISEDGPNGYGVDAFYSSDGGMSWTEVSVPGGIATLLSVSCGSANDCVAGGVGGGVAAFTSDGGLSWSPAAPSAEMSEIQFVSCSTAADCVGVGGGAPSGSGFYTTDGGDIWSQSSGLAGVPAGPGGSTPPKIWDLVGLSCPGIKFCMAVGMNLDGNPAEVITSDGGRSWS
jgi:hypothetical protein